MKKTLEDIITLSEQNPKWIYTQKDKVINNGTVFNIKKPLSFIIKPLIAIANFITKIRG